MFLSAIAKNSRSSQLAGCHIWVELRSVMHHHPSIYFYFPRPNHTALEGTLYWPP